MTIEQENRVMRRLLRNVWREACRIHDTQPGDLKYVAPYGTLAKIGKFLATKDN